MENVILALPMECWRWIPGYEGLYQVSTRGRVRSVGRWVNSKNGSKQFREGKILKLKQNKFGYLTVMLSRNGKQRDFRVNRLVAMAWLDNPDGKPQINHRDEDKTNNSVENLSYCTAKANSNWGTRNKRIADSKSMPVQALDPETGVVIMEFPSAKEAERKGFLKRNISACCHGYRRVHKGFAWRFKQE